METRVIDLEGYLGEVFGVPMSLKALWAVDLQMPGTCPFCGSGALVDHVHGAWVRECTGCGTLISRLDDTLTF